MGNCRSTLAGKAHRAVRIAINSGRIRRPEICQRCGANPGAGKDGRSKIHAHHHDYSKPLEVEWICAACHRRETPLPEVMGAPVPGERNGQAKLTYQQVLEIRKTNESAVVVGRRYGMSKSSINRIRAGHCWLAPIQEPQP